MLSGDVKKKKFSPSKPSENLKLPKTTNTLSPNKAHTKFHLNKNILFPKKKMAKETLGTLSSCLEEDSQRSPGEVPGETSVVNFEDSGSEYIPSDGMNLKSIYVCFLLLFSCLNSFSNIYPSFSRQ